MPPITGKLPGAPGARTTDTNGGPARPAGPLGEGEPRREKLAVNLFDLDRVDPLIRAELLGGKIDVKAGPVRIDPRRPDLAAVGFRCDLLTAAIVCDILRSHDRELGDAPTRVYIKRAEAWEPLAGRVVLTVVVDGKCQLSPEVFPPVLELLPVAPPAPTGPVVFGGRRCQRSTS